MKLMTVDCFQVTSQTVLLPATSVPLSSTSAFLLSLSSVPITTTGDVVPTANGGTVVLALTAFTTWIDSRPLPVSCTVSWMYQWSLLSRCGLVRLQVGGVLSP